MITKNNKEEKIEELLNKIEISFKEESNGQRVFLNGEDVSTEIRTKQITDIISEVSKIPQVRGRLLELQRDLAKGQSIVMEGRDIGTVVFPNADVKIYLDASAEERTRRRIRQNEEKGIKMSYEEVLENVIRRDKNDKNKKIAYFLSYHLEIWNTREWVQF